MDIERILRNTPSTLSVTFYGDTAPTNADGAVTVTVYKQDGTMLGSANQATTHPGLGTYSYILPPQSVLRFLRLEWNGFFAGVASTITSFVEIVGGFYFSLFEARNYDKVITDATKYPDELLKEARVFVETEFERICQRAFVPRGAYEVLTGDNTSYLYLANPEITKIVSLTVDGTDWTNTPIRTDGSRAIQLVDGRWFNYASYGASNIVIEYEYGAPFVPADIKRAALKRMRSVVIGQQNRIDERATIMSIPDFGTFNLATPGRNSFTGIPDVDAVLLGNQWAGGINIG